MKPVKTYCKILFKKFYNNTKRVNKQYITGLIILSCFFSSSIFAYSCQQSDSIPLASAHEQTTTLSNQFMDISHIEILPEKIITEKEGFKIDTVQVLICGELKSKTPIAATQGQACQFDSNCTKPMRCQNNLCVSPAP